MKKRQLVGIINCTPDSFYSKGRFSCAEEAIEYGIQLFEEGADVIDIGGESTRPGSEHIVTEEEELKRVLPVIKGLRQKVCCLLSIDTFKPKVALAALDEGVDWINDVTGFSNPEMQKIAYEKNATCCVMHMYGPPHSQPIAHYPHGVVQEILFFFQRRVQDLLAAGISSSKIILDPGIGAGSFGKNPDESLAIIKNIKLFTTIGYPILIGISRKSFMQIILQKPPTDVLSTTLALNTMALLEGATFIRVHDVAAHRDILTIFEKIDGICTHPHSNH